MDSSIEIGRLIRVFFVFLDINTLFSKNFTRRFNTKAIAKPMRIGDIKLKKDVIAERIGVRWKTVKISKIVKVIKNKICRKTFFGISVFVLKGIIIPPVFNNCINGMLS